MQNQINKFDPQLLFIIIINLFILFYQVVDFPRSLNSSKSQGLHSIRWRSLQSCARTSSTSRQQCRENCLSSKSANARFFFFSFRSFFCLKTKNDCVWFPREKCTQEFRKVRIRLHILAGPLIQVMMHGAKLDKLVYVINYNYSHCEKNGKYTFITPSSLSFFLLSPEPTVPLCRSSFSLARR